MNIKIKSISLIVFLLIQVNDVLAQENNAKFWGLEAGMDFIGCGSPEKDYIRGDIPAYGYGEVTDNLLGLMYKAYLGAKVERRFLNNKLGLLGGVRYTRMQTSIGKNTYWSGTSSFFYLLYRQNGTTTEFLKVQELNQTAHYLGVPIGLRFFPFNQENELQLYFKAGSEFNFLLKTEKDVVFYDKAMEAYESEVGKIMGNPNSFYTALYLSAGFQMDTNSKPGINFEVCLPYFFLTTKAFNLVTPQVGGGFQLYVQMPF